MGKIKPLKLTPLGDVDSYTPSRERAVRVRARSMPADTHFEPQAHPWAQLAYCAKGIVQVTAAQSSQSLVTYFVPPSRAVWIAPGAQHHITVLEAAEFRTLYIDAAAIPDGWNSCRVIVVSALLRETILALDHPLTSAREQLLISLALDEITHADTQALGVPMPHPQSGDKRLRVLCEAVMRAPAKRATLAEWASDIGASERTAARLFREELGLSFQQ